MFWDGKPELNLSQDPHTGKERTFFSKAQKASYLKERGIAEAGDRVHGAPVEVSRNQAINKVDSRHEVQLALRKVKQMGRDQRHQAYLKLMKDNEKRQQRRYGPLN